MPNIFLPHIAVFLGLIALGFGYSISLQPKGKWVGLFIAIVAALGLVCIAYLSFAKCCHSGLASDEFYKMHMQMMAAPEVAPKIEKKK